MNIVGTNDGMNPNVITAEMSTEQLSLVGMIVAIVMTTRDRPINGTMTIDQPRRMAERIEVALDPTTTAGITPIDGRG